MEVIETYKPVQTQICVPNNLLTDEEVEAVHEFIQVLVSHRKPSLLDSFKGKYDTFLSEKDEICKTLGVSFTAMCLKNRRSHLSDLRAAFYIILKIRYGFTKVNIGDIIERDHSSVVGGLKSFFRLLSVKDAEISKLWKKIEPWIAERWNFLNINKPTQMSFPIVIENIEKDCVKCRIKQQA